MECILRRISPGIMLCCLLVGTSGCQTLKDLATLKDVQFSLDKVTDMVLAGVALSEMRSYNDLRPQDLLSLGRAVAARELPLAFTLHVYATNPGENPVGARLVQLDWTLFLEDQETISGVFEGDVDLQPGIPTAIPLPVGLDLIQFFDRSARDLVELVLALAGQGGAPKNIRLQAVPTVQTPLGPVRYPRPVTIVSREVGASS